MEMPTLKAIHIAKSHQPTLNPKLVKECVCPNARTEKEKARVHNNTYT